MCMINEMKRRIEELEKDRTRLIEFVKELSDTKPYPSHPLGNDDSICDYWKDDATELLKELGEID